MSESPKDGESGSPEVRKTESERRGDWKLEPNKLYIWIGMCRSAITVRELNIP